MKGKESQQHEPSVSKYNDIVIKSMETQKVIKRNEKEAQKNQKFESGNKEEESELYLKQKSKSQKEHQEKTKEEESRISTKNVLYSDNSENRTLKLKKFFDKHSSETKNKKFTYEVIEEIMERKEVTYFITMS